MQKFVLLTLAVVGTVSLTAPSSAVEVNQNSSLGQAVSPQTGKPISAKPGLTSLKPKGRQLTAQKPRLGQSGWSSAFEGIAVKNSKPGGAIASASALQPAGTRRFGTEPAAASSWAGEVFTPRLGR